MIEIENTVIKFKIQWLCLVTEELVNWKIKKEKDKNLPRIWHRETKRWKTEQKDIEDIGRRCNLVLVRIPKGKYTDSML